jgi:uncharacterized membrane protein YccC
VTKRRIQLASHDLIGVRFALNVFVASAILWYLLRQVADTNPTWAIASMVASSEPQVKEAHRMFRSRLTNVSIGCVVGLVLLVTGGAAEWKVPLALAIAVLVSSYLIHVQTMWRQAPITAALVVSSGLLHESKVTGIESGLHKVAEVVVGCLIGVGVSWLMSKLWPLREGHAAV